MREPTKITIESVWRKNNLKCRIKSEKEFCTPPDFELNRPSRKAKVTFAGYNPFPCYSMETTIGVLVKWMRDNDWERIPGGYREIVYYIVDDVTGEIHGTTVEKETYVPVMAEGRLR